MKPDVKVSSRFLCALTIIALFIRPATAAADSGGQNPKPQDTSAAASPVLKTDYDWLLGNEGSQKSRQESSSSPGVGLGFGLRLNEGPAFESALWGSSGAMAGTLAGPMGTIIGAAVGTISGFFVGLFSLPPKSARQR